MNRRVTQQNNAEDIRQELRNIADELGETNEGNIDERFPRRVRARAEKARATATPAPRGSWRRRGGGRAMTPISAPTDTRLDGVGPTSSALRPRLLRPWAHMTVAVLTLAAVEAVQMRRSEVA